MRRRALPVLLTLALASCGYYPEPFVGHPGVMGARLAVPPPPRLAVPPPPEAMLPSRDAASLAGDLAAALQEAEVPAVAEPVHKGDWWVEVRADLQPASARGAMVQITYTVRDPKGVDAGTVAAPPVSAETWSMASAVALRAVAARDAPRLAALLDRIKAARQLSDPDSLVNRAPKIDLVGISGAPGDGDTALARTVSAALANAGLVVQDTQAGADFALKGEVTLSPAPKGQQRVEITWLVADLYGREVGHVVQMNDVPQGSLDRYWADVAEAVAEQAAGGVKEAIENQVRTRSTGRRDAK